MDLAASDSSSSFTMRWIAYGTSQQVETDVRKFVGGAKEDGNQ
ncbi:hypothetical protein I7I51_08668 [Histoplasma capsulatum]|uniref:Uncharacterized protein n=1 Tax=Ajellomyces capsulatus TaxID=5037 RepID=A0A8A1M0Z2_AJECA|nr:hypothetical protein I7I51_08668 [Histoplasma capsulatum]